MNYNDNFRDDINALRALAVIFVVLYHFDVPGFRGGFLGVDIFFVISGYLMSRIIFNAHAQSHFSVMLFYWARVKRIVPALLVLCVILLFVGYLFLLPTDYRLLGKHIGSSLGFISNWVYLTESGYFDATSHDKWLLHTWSLSVEWQFYIAYPLIMAIMLRFIPSQYWLAILVLGSIASYTYGINSTNVAPTAAFFLLPSRAWEMTCGRIVLLLSHQKILPRQSSQILAWCGLTVIITSLALIDTHIAWPGSLAAMPVIGTMIVIAANNPNQRWQSNTAVQAVGRWSYSIYLWHWPIIVAINFMNLRDDIGLKILGIMLAILLGWVSYRWVETPTRKALVNYTIRRGTLKLLSGFMLCLLLSTAVYLDDGIPSRRLPAPAKLADLEKLNRIRPAINATECQETLDATLHPCIYGKEGPLGAIVLGDSHSTALVTAISEALAPTAAPTVMNYSFNACPTVSGIKHHNKRFQACGGFIESAIATLSREHFGVPVIIVNRWPAYLEGPAVNDPEAGKRFISFNNDESDAEFSDSFKKGLSSSVCKLVEAGHPVFVVLPIPEMPFNVPNHMARAAMLTKQSKDVNLPLSAYEQRNRRAINILTSIKGQCDVRLLDPTKHLCSEHNCFGSINGRPLYYDDNHLSEFGNKLLVPMFQNALDN